MAMRRITSGQIIEMLQNDNDELKTRVYELNEKIRRLEARGRRASEMQAAAWGASRPHIQAKQKLEWAVIWIYIAWLLIAQVNHPQLDPVEFLLNFVGFRSYPDRIPTAGLLILGGVCRVSCTKSNILCNFVL